MSRDIKFRIYDTVEKEMFYQEDIAYINFNSGIASIYQENGYDYLINFNGDDGEIMRNAGIKDKNGIEIYEGDIIQFVGDGCKANGVVKYGIRRFHNEFNEKNELGFYVDWSSELWWRRDLVFWIRKCEVIGNIYENPELMWRGEENEIEKR